MHQPCPPPPPDFSRVREEIEAHGLRMKQARMTWLKADICPDCFKPWPHCYHVSKRRPA